MHGYYRFGDVDKIEWLGKRLKTYPFTVNVCGYERKVYLYNGGWFGLTVLFVSPSLTGTTGPYKYFTVREGDTYTPEAPHKEAHYLAKHLIKEFKASGSKVPVGKARLQHRKRRAKAKGARG